MAAKQKFKQGLELWGLELRSNNGGVVTLANSLGIFVHANTADRTYTLPNATGTLALTSDIHAPVTLGTANGLSLATQALSLGLASSGVTGALSGTDWNTFNGKQAALNGTGLVRMAGTTVSYDNNTYLISGGPISGTTGTFSGTVYVQNGLISVEGTVPTIKLVNGSYPRATITLSNLDQYTRIRSHTSLGALIDDVITIPNVANGTIAFSATRPITGLSFNLITGLASVVSPVNGTAAVGTSTTVARQDHVHGTDTTRAQDSLVVHLAGTETITGVKSFTGNTNFANVFVALSAAYDQFHVSSHGTPGQGITFECINVARNGYTSLRIFASAWKLHNGTADIVTITSTGNITATQFIKSGGTSAQFLKADGSVDSSTYSTTAHNHTGVYQPLATNLTSIGALANAAGVLSNNGTGTFSYVALPTVNAGTLGASAATAGATNTTVALNFSAAWNANSASNVTINPVVGPAITALATLMTGATTGFLKKTAADTYTLDTSTYLTALPAHTLDSHSNVTITANSAGEILKWSGTAWINNTLAEAGIQPAGTYLTSGGALGTPSSGTLTNCTFPTLNQNTTGSAYSLNCLDTRAVVTTPETVASPLIKFEFKTNATESLSDGGTYFGEMTFRKYGSSTDWTGGGSHQLGFTDNGNIHHRYGSSTTWGTWFKLWDSNNLTNLNQLINGPGYTSNTGTVTAIGVTTANGVSGSSSGGATPNLTITLGAITPTSVNGLTLATNGNNGRDWATAPVPYITGSGVIEIGKYLDWHETSNDGVDYAARMTCTSGGIVFSGGLTAHGEVYIGGVIRSNGSQSVNLHLDPVAGTNATYLNFYQGTGGVNFGNGASGVVASVSSSGIIDASLFRTSFTNGTNYAYTHLAGYYAAAATTTGTIKIAIPSAAYGTMVVLRIVGYDYSSENAWELNIGGYVYSTDVNGWHSPARSVRGTNCPFTSVRFAKDPSGYPCILLGVMATSWSYETITITEAITGYSAQNQLAGTTISLLANETSYVASAAYDPNSISTVSSVTATSFVKTSGTSAQFLKADGSVDSNAYSTTAHNHSGVYAPVAQTFYLGTTSIAINRTSGAIALTGITSIDGSSAQIQLNTTTSTVYLMGASGVSGTGYLYGITSVYMTNGTVYGSDFSASSDERLKENWEDLPVDFISQLAKVKVGTYHRIDNDKMSIGASAQSLQKCMPLAVRAGEDQMLSISYGNAALVSAVELAKEVEKLKEKIAMLEERLAS